MLAEIVFWTLLLIIFYTYIGYGLIILILKYLGFLKNRKGSEDYLPDVTIVIASYNEEKILKAKVENTVSLNYPQEKIKIIVVADGSTDGSLAILSAYKNILVLHQPERKGKAHALNRAMEIVQSPVVVFTDANCMLNKDSIKNIARHFKNEKVGAVTGEKKIINHTGTGDAEGFYWKYESFMKQLDALLFSVVGAAGELFAIRTDLYKPLKEDVLLDDFILSVRVCLEGYIIAYEPGAYALESASSSLAQEKVRKRRIAAGAFQSLSIISFKKLLKRPLFFLQFISRRWLRWVVCPFAIILLLMLNVFLASETAFNIYDVLLVIQVCFYIAAFFGWTLIQKNKSFFLTTISFYFLFMNFCMLLGLVDFLSKNHSVLWQKADR